MYAYLYIYEIYVQLIPYLQLFSLNKPCLSLSESESESDTHNQLSGDYSEVVCG